MGLFLSNGTRVTQSTLVSAAETDPLVTIGTDLYLREPYSVTDPVVGGGKLTLFCRAGKVLRTSAVALLFPDPDVSAVSPATGAAAGGTVVTLTGVNFDGTTAVTFGGVAGTALTIVSATKITVTTPTHAAGAVDVVVTDDGGIDTVVGGFTYTA